MPLDRLRRLRLTAALHRCLEAGASAVAITSMFLFTDHSPIKLRSHLFSRGLSAREPYQPQLNARIVSSCDRCNGPRRVCAEAVENSCSRRSGRSAAICTTFVDGRPGARSSTASRASGVKGFFADGEDARFHHLHTDQYAMFLYYLANTARERPGHPIADEGLRAEQGAARARRVLRGGAARGVRCPASGRHRARPRAAIRTISSAITTARSARISRTTTLSSGRGIVMYGGSTR